MSKFKYNSEDYQKSVDWSKTIIIENGKTLYDVAKNFSSDSVEFISFVNNFKTK